MKKINLIFTFLLLIGIAVLVKIFIFKSKQTVTTDSKKTKKTAVINELPVEERPFITLVPSESGGEIFISIDNSKDKLLEYEIEYQAKSDEGGTIIQGGMGRIDLSSASQPTEPKEFCFCSQSKNVKKYDKGVTSGEVVLSFSGGAKDYVLKGDFTVGNFGEKDGVFNSRNGKISLDMSREKLASSTVVVVTDTLGLPGKLEQELLEGPYGFFSASPVKLSGSQLSFKTSKDITNAKVMGWDKQAEEWVEYKTGLSKEEGEISVKVTSLTTFVLVNSAQ